MALGQPDGLQPVLALLGAGLLYPLLEGPAEGPPLRTFEQWLAAPGPAGLTVFTHPIIAARALGLGEDLGLPELGGVRGQGSGVREDQREESGAREAKGADAGSSLPSSSLSSLTPDPRPLTPVHEADGLEWLLRLAALWQSAAAPLRRTQTGGY